MLRHNMEPEPTLPLVNLSKRFDELLSITTPFSKSGRKSIREIVVLYR